MCKNTLHNQMEIFLKQLLLMNVLFPLFITVTAVFFYIQGMSSSFILGSVLFLLMGYNIIMARYGFVLWIDVRRSREQATSSS
ncbi:MAG: hypothetical protein ACMUHY_00070 [Thermoplasmatota archaeon]